MDKERFSQFVATSYQKCKERILSAQIHEEESRLKEKKPNGQKKMPLRETSYYELTERHYENGALENKVSPEN